VITSQTSGCTRTPDFSTVTVALFELKKHEEKKPLGRSEYRY